MATFKNLSKKKTTKQNNLPYRKKAVQTFITRLKSWVNYVCLSSNVANQLFVYLAPPRGPGPYACLDCERGHTGQDPAKPRWDTRLRVLKCVRASICYD